MAAFFILAVLFFLWTLPWLPSGLDANDYTPELAFTIYLLSGVSLSGISTLALRELTRRKRESLIAWSSLYDEATGLHNRAYLYDRLSLECERAERKGGVFSVFVLQIRSSASKPILSNAALRRLAEMINGCTNPTDLVALLSGSELGILAIGVGQEARAVLLETLQAVVADELSRHLDTATTVNVIGGTATYGVHGKEPAALVQAARTAATVGSLPRLRAA
jgi:GGDEF domain-containing protein